MDTKELKNKIKSVLAELLGVEESDIGDDDDFITDLQMEPTSLFDFKERLENDGVDMSDVDFKEVLNIEELIDTLEGASIGSSGTQEE